MTRPPRIPVSDILLLLLWAAALLHIVWPDLLLARIGGGFLILYMVMVFPRIRRQLRILCGFLIISALALGFWVNGWSALWTGIERAVIFAAFFGTLTVLRATADRRPEIARARHLVGQLHAQERDSGFMVGSNVLGSMLIVGVMAVFAPIAGASAPYEVRKAAAEACQRGMCLACLWSPFWVAMALATEHLPGVALWQIMMLGLVIMPVGLILAQILYTPDVGIAGLWRALAALLPILPPVAIAAAAILILNGLTPLTTLQCLVIGIPLLCTGALIQQGAHHLRPALLQARVGIGAVRGEVVLMSSAFALGHVLQLALTVGGAGEAVAALELPSWVIIAFVPVMITVFGFIGVHQVVTATVALVLFGAFDFGIAPLVLMEAVLLGWAFASMTGISAVSVASAAAMFGVPLEVIAYGPNLKFVAVFGAVAIAMLVLINGMVT